MQDLIKSGKNLFSLLHLLCLILFFCPRTLFSQENIVTDSLNALLKQSKNKTDILNSLAAECQYISPARSLMLSSEALETSKKEKNEKGEAYACYYIASNYLSLGQYDTCLKMLDRSETLFRKLNNIEGLLHISNARANLRYLQGNLDDALQQFQDNLLNSEKNNLPRIRISALTNIGRINWLRGKTATALSYYNEALQKCDSVKTPYMQGMIHLLTGIVYQDLGYYELAASKILSSIQIFERMNYLTKLPYAYNYLGSVYYEMQDDDNAINYLRKASYGLKQIGDDWGLAISQRFMGRAFRRLKLQDSAEYYYRNSLKLARKLNDRSGEISSMRFLGEVFLDQGKGDSAYILLNESLRKSMALKDMRERVNILYDLGILNDRQNNFIRSLSLLHNAGYLADSLDLFYENMLINKQLAETYEKSGDLKSSLKYYKLYKSLNDTVNSSEKRKNVDELQLRYETEKKNNEIGALRMQQRIQQVRLKNQRILGYSLGTVLILVIAFIIVLWYNYRQKKKANEEKEILLKEIHHRVKNNLQTISSLLSLQSFSIGDDKVKDAVRESQERVKSMALIHQMLYQQEKLSEIDFGQYLQKLVESISSGYHNPAARVSYHIDCDNARLDIDTAIPLGLIANELLINAYKYAFNGRNQGDIFISLVRNNTNKYLFRIKDNGIGLPGHISIDKAETLGLRLVSLLVRQIKGNIAFSTTGGTEFTITF